MEVIVRDTSAESAWGSGPTRPATRKVIISDHCQSPGCGAKRGEPKNYNGSEDGAYFGVHTWSNPCGHPDYYADVIIEAKALAKAQGRILPEPMYH